MPDRRQILTALPLVFISSAGCLTNSSERSNSTPISETEDTTATAEGGRTTKPGSTAQSTPERTTPSPTPVSTPTQSATPTPTATPEPTATATVSISGGAFSPQRLPVESNTLVKWVNQDIDTHQIVSMRLDQETTPWEFESVKFGRSESVEYVFREPGLYAYFSSKWGKSTSCGLVTVGESTFDGNLPCESSGGY